MELWKRAVRRWRLPEDVLLGAALVQLTGREQARIENHRGVAECTPELVRVRTANGEICLRGEGLWLRELARDDLICVGRIRLVELHEAP